MKTISKYLLIGSIALLFITKISYLIQGNNSPARWLYISGFSIQTSDIARLSIIIYLATFIDHYREKIKDFYNGFAILIGILAFTMGLIVIQPDFSTAAMIGLIGFMMLTALNINCLASMAGTVVFVYKLTMPLVLKYRGIAT